MCSKFIEQTLHAAIALVRVRHERILRRLLVVCAVVPLAFTSGCTNTVSSNLAPLAISSFAPAPDTITVGQSTSLVWSVAGAQSLSLTADTGPVQVSAAMAVTANSLRVSPTATTQYTLTATDPSGSNMTATATVTVVPPPLIQSFTASPALIGTGQATTLTWVLTSGAQVSLDQGIGQITGSSIQVSPTTTTTYTITVLNAAGSVTTAQVTVSVVLSPSIANFTASPPEIGLGQSSTLTWSVLNATSVSLDNGIGLIAGNTISVNPAQTVTFTLTATNTLGTFSASTSAQVTVKVSASPPPVINSFLSSLPSTAVGNAVELTPVFIPTDGSATASIDNGIGAVTSGVPIAGPPLNGSTTYTLTVTNKTGTATAQERVLAGKLSLYVGRPTFAGVDDGTGTLAKFNGPAGIAVDASGNLFVADQNNNTIRKIAPGGVVTTFAGTPNVSPGSTDGSNALFNAPYGVAVDAAGNVYVSDTGNYTIRKITPSGVTSTFAGSATQQGQLDGTGTAANFSSPEGLAIDSVGNLYVADSLNCNIRKISPAGVVSTLAGPPVTPQCGAKDGVGAAARFIGPVGIAVAPSGNVFVADTNNSTIRKITPDGLVTTLAGHAPSAGYVDAVGDSARFIQPVGLAVDGSEILYVTEAGGYTVRKIKPDGTVTTVVGTKFLPDAYVNGGDLPGNLAVPTQLVMDPVSGKMYITLGTVSAIASAPF